MEDPPVLFAYGTLRKAFHHPMAKFLEERVRHVGLGKTPGRLYDLGRYPAMIAASEPDDWVHGDVYELLEVHATIAELDRYEGALYRRTSGPVVLRDGKTVTACFYVYVGPVQEDQRIPAGDYFDVLGRNRGVSVVGGGGGAS